MRSRASGGICGDSSAAPSAATMSSLRRRAICVTRARSIARSSTGGRASARTTAPASPGSTSSRSQASRSRTSARWKNAAAPDSRYGTARSSNATATAWPSPRTERTSTQTSSGATSSRAISRSTSAATACACARSEAQRQNATSPPGSPCSAFSTGPRHDRLRRRRGSRSRERNERSSRTTVAAGHSARKSWMFLVAAPRKRWIAWSSSAAAVTLPARREQPQQQALREAGVLELVDQHVPVAARRAARARAASSRSRRKLRSTRSPDVERARLLEHRARARRRARRTRARAARSSAGRPRRVVVRRHQLVLEPVDALDDRAQRGARVAAQVVVAQRQVVDPLQQHGQPVGGADRRHERVEPGLERLVAQQARAEAVEGGDRELLVGALEPVLELARAARRRPRSSSRGRAATPAARPPRTRCRKRSARTVVLPLPAPPRTAAGRRNARRRRAARGSAPTPS